MMLSHIWHLNSASFPRILYYQQKATRWKDVLVIREEFITTLQNHRSTWLNFQWRHNLIKCTFLLHTWPFPSPNPSSKPNLTCTTVQCTIYEPFLLGRTTSNVKFWHVSLYLDILKSRDLSSIAKLVHTHPHTDLRSYTTDIVCIAQPVHTETVSQTQTQWQSPLLSDVI